MTRRAAGRPGPAPTLGVLRPFLAPVGSLVVLAIVAIATLAFLTGDVRLPAGGNGDGNGDGGPIGPPRTAAPSNVVIVDPRTEVPGSIVYVKAGNLWIQSGVEAHQITDGGRDAMPAWSPDGQWIYFVRTRPEVGRWPVDGRNRTFAMDVPALVRVKPDGSGAETILDGLIKRGSLRWFFWIREPSPSPDGTTVALITDGPDPNKSDIVLQLLDLATGKLSPAGAPETKPLGHQNPAWRPDGKFLAYVRNNRLGALGTPTIQRYDAATKKTNGVTAEGYLAPSWAAGGRFLAATKTTSFGTDVVIIDTRTGAEVVRLSDDGRSWSPAFSPGGDAVVFLHRAGDLVDLKLVRLAGSGETWTVGEVLDVTLLSGLDGASRPSWWIAPEDLPQPAPTPSPSPGPSGVAPSASPSALGQP